MSTDAWISSHREFNQHTNIHPSSSSSSPSLVNMDFVQDTSATFSKSYFPELHSFSFKGCTDSHLYNSYLSQKLLSNCMREQQPNDYNPQQFQDLFYKIIQTFPQFDTMQKSLSTNELSPEKSAQDLTVNRGQYDLNASDFNCSNTTLGTLPSPSEKSSPHDSSLCHSQHTSTEMKKHQTDYQQLNHQQEKDDKAVRHATECQNKLFSCIINDERERRKHASSQRNAFHFSSVNNTRDNISPLDAAIQYEKSPNSIRNIDIDTVESYKLHTKELAQNYHCHYHHCQKNNESSADEYHAINLSMKENNLSKTKLPYQPDISEHNIQANDQSLFNSKLHEYYTKLLQINYFEWLRYLLCQPLRVSGNPSASSPIPSLSHINNDYYSINDKFHDVSNMNNINHILVGDQCSTDPQTTDLQSVHLSSTNSSVNSDIFGTNYSNDLSYLYKTVQSNFLSDIYQSTIRNSLSKNISTSPSCLPLKLTKLGSHLLTNDNLNSLSGTCSTKSKKHYANAILQKNDDNGNKRSTQSIDQIIINNGSNTYACKLCSKVYSQASALKMHVRTHTLPCRCTHCGKSFSRKWLLKGHERTHTGERPYSCTVCGRSFADRSNLRAHMQTHQREKRYSCSYCPRSFSRMGLLNKHILQCSHQNNGSNEIVNKRRDGNHCFSIDLLNVKQSQSLVKTINNLLEN